MHLIQVNVIIFNPLTSFYSIEKLQIQLVLVLDCIPLTSSSMLIFSQNRRLLKPSMRAVSAYNIHVYALHSLTC